MTGSWIKPRCGRSNHKLRSVVLGGGGGGGGRGRRWFCPLGTFGSNPRHFYWSQRLGWGGFTGFYRREGRDALKHPTKHRAAPTAKTDLKRKSAKAEKLCSRLRFYSSQNVHSYLCALPFSGFVFLKVYLVFLFGSPLWLHRIMKDFLLFQVCLWYTIHQFHIP